MSTKDHSLAHEVPPELFDSILLYIGSNWSSNAEWKAASSICSLVCRWWAKQCRRQRFNTIRVTSHARLRELAQLLTFDHEALPSISTHIRRIRLEPKPDDLPWLHLVSLSLLSMLTDHTVTIELNLKSICTDPATNWRQIYRGLPRSTPVVCNSVNELDLQGVQLKRGEDLVRLVRRFSKLRGLVLQSDWEVPPTSHGVPQLRNPRFTVDGSIMGPEESGPMQWFTLARVETLCPPQLPSSPDKLYRVDAESLDYVMAVFRAASQPNGVPNGGTSQYYQLCRVGSSSSGLSDIFDVWTQSDVTIHEIDGTYGIQSIRLKFLLGPDIPFPGAPYASAVLNHVEVVYNELEFNDGTLDSLYKSFPSLDGGDGKDRVHAGLHFLHASWANVAALSKKLRRVDFRVVVRAYSLEYLRAQHKALQIFCGTSVSVQRLLCYRFSRSQREVERPRLNEDWPEDIDRTHFVL